MSECSSIMHGGPLASCLRLLPGPGSPPRPVNTEFVTEELDVLRVLW